jgi:hypothetical protein
LLDVLLETKVQTSDFVTGRFQGRGKKSQSQGSNRVGQHFDVGGDEENAHIKFGVM